MKVDEVYLILSAALAGIGIGAALSRRNIMSITLSLVTASSGALIAICALNQDVAKRGDSMLFAMCLGASLLFLAVLGCAFAYRRYMATGTRSIDKANELRH